MNTLLDKHWHHLPAQEVVDLLDTDIQLGLDIFEVKHRQQRFGLNVLTPKKGKSSLVRFLQQFNNPLVIILLVASVITAVCERPGGRGGDFRRGIDKCHYRLYSRIGAEHAIAALAQTMTTEATVIRGGQVIRLPAAELVPGDMVQLQAGLRVPADLRLLNSRISRLQKPRLTGELLPVEKDAMLLVAHDAVLAERRNMAYASTLVDLRSGRLAWWSPPVTIAKWGEFQINLQRG